MIAFLFPGQASQFEGMGKDYFENYSDAKELFLKANKILGFDITSVMFEGTMEELKQTKVTQPAVFLHSYISSVINREKYTPDVVAGHSLGEFTALVANGALSFEDGLRLVQIRANAMQKACEAEPSTMAAILGLDDNIVEDVCRGIDEVVIPANYNCPGQLVISGSVAGIETAVTLLKEKGARMAVTLQVGGAFHSPLMEPAKKELEDAILGIQFNRPKIPIFQNVNGQIEKEPDVIKQNLIDQLTAPVLWTKIINNMIDFGIEKFIEVGGNGKTLVNFVKRIDRKKFIDSI